MTKIDVSENPRVFHLVQYNNRGEILLARGETDAALRDFDRALRIRPSLAAAYYNRARLECARGRRKEAAADFKRAFRLDAELEATDNAETCLAALPREMAFGD